MGAQEFITRAEGADADAAFEDACADAAHEYGNRGYTGTIAEKDSYVIITDTITPIDEATTLAQRLLTADDPRIHDRRGPAAAIPISAATRTVRVTDLAGTWAGNTLTGDDLDQVVTAGRRRGQLDEHDTITSANLIDFTPTGRSRHYTNGIAVLTVHRDPAGPPRTTPDGWLFFGLAAC